MPEAESHRADQTIAEWRRAGENHDAAQAIACLAGNVVLISPLTAQFTFDGRDRVGDVLTAGFQVIDEIRFHTEVGDDRTRALFYYGRCGQQPFGPSRIEFHVAVENCYPIRFRSPPAGIDRAREAGTLDHPARKFRGITIFNVCEADRVQGR